MKEFDLIVIGFGASGISAALAASALGARVALVEKSRGQFLRSGGAARKALGQSARVYSLCKEATEFGVRVENPRLIWGAVRLRIADVCDDIRQLQREKLTAAKTELFSGDARFEDASTLRVSGKNGEQILRAPKFILAIDGEHPSTDELQKIETLAPQDIFTLPNFPRSLIIIGHDAAACEFAQALARLDCRVTLLSRASTLLPRADGELGAFAEKILSQNGVAVHRGVSIQSAQDDGDKKTVTFEIGEETQSVSAGKILLIPETTADFSDLNLEAIGARRSTRGVEADEYLRAAPSLWICGAAEGDFALAAKNALQDAAQKWEESSAAQAIFTDPEIASVGLTEAQARERLGNIEVYRRQFSQVERAVIEGETRGFLKIVTDAEGKVLGAHLAGPNAGELIHTFAVAMRAGVLLEELGETPLVHPTFAEILRR